VDDNIKMKIKLLDTKIIKGLHIERSKNLNSSFYDIKETPDIIEYKKKNEKTGAVDFEQLLKDRTP
jgi:hypothetical protein